jgi:hypothetical protein
MWEDSELPEEVTEMPAQADEIVEMPKTEEQRRAYAIRRIKEKSDFWTHLIVYLTINAMLVVIWFMTSRGNWFFWPIVPILAWGVGLVIHGYTVYRGPLVSENQIQRELQQLPH